MRTKNITTPEIGDMLLPITHKVPYINNGGCGIFASYLYKELVKYGFKPKILTLTSYGVDKDEIRDYKNSYLPNLRYSRKNNRSPNNGAKSHYMVKLGNFALDCSGSFAFQKQKDHTVKIEKREYIYGILGTISIEDLDYLIKMEWAWNYCFERKHSPKIQRLIKKQLAKILN